MPAALPDDADVPVVSARAPCPCGSGKKYKACHGRVARVEPSARPFEGLPGEVEWVALREVVPAATAPLRVRGSDRPVTLSTVLPMAWPALVRQDGRVMLGLQVPARTGDVSRDLGWALETALAAEPGTPVSSPSPPGPGARLQDLLDLDAPLEVTVHEGFDYWVEGAVDPEGEVAASMERANASVVPTARLTSVPGAYWCRMREKSHLRWVLPEPEAPALDALTRLAAGSGLALGEGTRYVGSFRSSGLLCPVWDLPLETEPDALEEPVAALRARLDEVLADPRPLTPEERRSRAGLVNRQVTLR